MRKEKRGQPQQPPTLEQLTAELARENYKRRFGRVLRSTLFTLVVVAAAAVLVGVFLFTLFRHPYVLNYHLNSAVILKLIDIYAEKHVSIFPFMQRKFRARHIKIHTAYGIFAVRQYELGMLARAYGNYSLDFQFSGNKCRHRI